MTKVVYNTSKYGFGLSNEALAMYAMRKGLDVSEINQFRIKRHDPDLVAVVEELKEKANDFTAKLRIKEINGNLYKIIDYYGAESVIEPDDDDDWVEVD